LGKGDLERGHKLLDGFTGYAGKPIDWHEGEDGDYILRQQDIEAVGGGSIKRGFRLLKRLFTER